MHHFHSEKDLMSLVVFTLLLIAYQHTQTELSWGPGDTFHKGCMLKNQNKARKLDKLIAHSFFYTMICSLFSLHHLGLLSVQFLPFALWQFASIVLTISHPSFLLYGIWAVNNRPSN